MRERWVRSRGEIRAAAGTGPTLANTLKLLCLCPGPISPNHLIGALLCFVALAPPGCQSALIGRQLDRLTADFRIDKTRMLTVGLSSGASLAYRLACQLFDRIAAIASVRARWQNF